MRRGEDCRGTLFFQLFPPTRLDVSQPPVGIRCTLLTIKGAHRFTRASVITRFSFETIELHQSLPAKIAIFIAMCFFYPPAFTLVFYYRIYCPDTIRINVISCLRILDPLWILSSPSWHLLTYLSLDSNLLAPRVISPRVFSLKILSERRWGKLEFQIESYCAKDAPFSAVNCILDVRASSKL